MAGGNSLDLIGDKKSLRLKIKKPSERISEDFFSLNFMPIFSYWPVFTFLIQTF